MMLLAASIWGCGGGADSKLQLAGRTLAMTTASAAAATLAPAAAGPAGADATGQDGRGAQDASAGSHNAVADGAEGTDQAGATPAAQDAQAAGGPASPGGRDLYAIVNLVPPTAMGARINARGQAAFEYLGLDYFARVGFFDGERVRHPLPPAETVSLLGALNERGELAFVARYLDPAHPLSNGLQPVRWSAARGAVFLPSLSSENSSYIPDINNRGEIVGATPTAAGGLANRAVRWTAANRLVPLGVPPGFDDTIATGINDHGISAGDAHTAAGGAHVVRWDAAGRPTDLGTFGARTAVASATNNRGDIAGMLDSGGGEDYRAFLWSPGRGAARAGLNTVVHALGESGDMVGRIQRLNNANHAFLFSRARGMVDLHPGGLYASEANSVNNHGVVVGLGRRGEFDLGRAYRWSRGLAVDLNTRLLDAPGGLVVTDALGIADNGDIVANSNAGMIMLRAGRRGTDAPVLGPIQLSELLLDRPARLTLSFRDRNPGESHTATVDWGDGRGPQRAVVREYRGRGVLRAENIYTREGDYAIIVRVTDSSGRSTVQYEQHLIRELDAPALVGEGVLADGVQGGGAASPLMFRLAVPLASRSAATGFTFRLAGRTSFKGERLEQALVDGDTVRLEGSGELDGRPGYRFVVEARPGDALSRPARLSVRISAPGAQASAQRAAPGADVLPALQVLRSGSLRLLQ
jgi:hypothetical protein